MAIEIASFPINSMVIFHSYVSYVYVYQRVIPLKTHKKNTIFLWFSQLFTFSRQCHGLRPAVTSFAPRASSIQEACAQVPEAGAREFN